MKPEIIERREIQFASLDEALQDANSLLQQGYLRVGNWTLGQICHHVRVTQDLCIAGYPKWMSLFAPLRPIMRAWMLPKVLKGTAKAGIKTASIFVPPGDLDDAVEVQRLEESVRRIQSFSGKFRPHPGFGRMDRKLFLQVHACHASHHLSFLVPNENIETDL